MRVPFLTEKVTDLIIRCMRTGNYITQDADVDILRGVSNNATETELNNLAASFHYGTVPGSASFMSNPEDINCFVDSDGTNPTSPYTNYFRIAKGQAGPPVVDPHKELLTVSSQSDPDGTAIMRLGPHRDVALAYGVDDHYTATMLFGCRVQAGTAKEYGFASTYVFPNPAMAFGSDYYDVYLLRPSSNKIVFGHSAMLSIHEEGSWGPNIFSNYGFTVGNSTSGVILERTYKGGHPWESYALRTSSTTQEEPVYINGSYPNTTADQRIKVCIGGSPGVANIDPDQMGFNTDEYPNGAGTRFHMFKTSCLIVSPNLAQDRGALFTFHRATAVPDYTELVTFDSNIDYNGANSDRVCLLRVTLRDGATRTGAFMVRGDRSVMCRGAYQNGQCDVAEVLCEVPQKIEPGTVISIAKDGHFYASDDIADKNVIGVVTEKPAMILGREESLADYEEGKVPLAIALAGTVPVKCTTALGPIECGSLLVSYPNGMACLAPENPVAGTVIGKALESLDNDVDDSVVGKIKMLVLAK